MAALSGLLVVAIEQAVAAPMCTVRLADAGARVIKVERPEGETARNYDSAVKGTSAYFAWLNRGKESAVLNLKEAADFRTLRQMLERADVLVQNLVPGALDRMGLSREVLESEFPGLITVSIVGYGQDTSYANKRAYDMLVQAESGLCSVTGTPEIPVKVGVSVADIATGMSAYGAVLEAIVERNRTGTGKQIEISMFDVLTDWMAVPLLHYEYGGTETRRHGLTHASIYPYRPYACSDGTLIVAIQSNTEWSRLCEIALERPELCRLSEFATNALRVANREAIDSEIEPVFKTMRTEQVIARLEKAAIAYGHYTELRSLGAHPALRRTEVTLPDGQLASLPRPPGRTSAFSAGAIPALGQHTESIRAEFGAGR